VESNRCGCEPESGFGVGSETRERVKAPCGGVVVATGSDTGHRASVVVACRARVTGESCAERSLGAMRGLAGRIGL